MSRAWPAPTQCRTALAAAISHCDGECTIVSRRSLVFCRTEYMPVESLLIIERGIASKDGRISVKGTCLGEDMVR